MRTAPVQWWRASRRCLRGEIICRLGEAGFARRTRQTGGRAGSAYRRATGGRWHTAARRGLVETPTPAGRHPERPAMAYRAGLPTARAGPSSSRPLVRATHLGAPRMPLARIDEIAQIEVALGQIKHRLRILGGCVRPRSAIDRDRARTFDQIGCEHSAAKFDVVLALKVCLIVGRLNAEYY
jgi:hypothetical protein